MPSLLPACCLLLAASPTPRFARGSWAVCVSGPTVRFVLASRFVQAAAAAIAIFGGIAIPLKAPRAHVAGAVVRCAVARRRSRHQGDVALHEAVEEALLCRQVLDVIVICTRL